MTELELRNKVVAVMRGWLGWSEANGKHKDIVDLYNTQRPLPRGYAVQYSDEWCATTVTAAGMKAGLHDIILGECSCTRMIELYRAAGRWEESDAYRPKPGDIILYDWQDTGRGDNTGGADHVGVVEKVAGSVITVIEGNKGEAVARRTLAINGRYIRGYCLPDYAGKADEEEDDMVRFNTMKEIEEGAAYALPTVRKLVSRGVIRGGGKKDDAGYPADMDLSRDMLRMLVMNDRAGAYGE